MFLRLPYGTNTFKLGYRVPPRGAGGGVEGNGQVYSAGPKLARRGAASVGRALRQAASGGRAHDGGRCGVRQRYQGRKIAKSANSSLDFVLSNFKNPPSRIERFSHVDASLSKWRDGAGSWGESGRGGGRSDRSFGAEPYPPLFVDKLEELRDHLKQARAPPVQQPAQTQTSTPRHKPLRFFCFMFFLLFF